MSNEPVAWMLNGILHECDPSDWAKEQYPDQYVIPLYTHPAKELHLSFQKTEDGELIAVTYIDDEHRIVEVLWEKPPAKTLTDEEINEIIRVEANKDPAGIGWTFAFNTARAILKKAQEK